MQKELYTLEHSQWSQDQGLFAWHITTLEEAIERNLQDYFHNNRGPNKWQVVGVFGTLEECATAMDKLIDAKARKKPVNVR
jgi:hypothetical protein